jgi:hypothetical protein
MVQLNGRKGMRAANFGHFNVPVIRVMDVTIDPAVVCKRSPMIRPQIPLDTSIKCTSQDDGRGETSPSCQ